MKALPLVVAAAFLLRSAHSFVSSVGRRRGRATALTRTNGKRVSQRVVPKRITFTVNEPEPRLQRELRGTGLHNTVVILDFNNLRGKVSFFFHCGTKPN